MLKWYDLLKIAGVFFLVGLIDQLVQFQMFADMYLEATGQIYVMYWWEFKYFVTKIGLSVLVLGIGLGVHAIHKYFIRHNINFADLIRIRIDKKIQKKLNKRVNRNE